MAVLIHYSKREKTSVDYERGPDQVSVDGIPPCAPASLDLYEHAKLIVDGIHLVGDDHFPLITK